MADLKINLGATDPGSPAKPAASPLAVKPAVATPSATPTPAVKPAPPTLITLKPAAAPVPLAILTPVAQAPSSFKDLFSKTAAKTDGPKMMETLGASKTTVADKLKPILGSSPQLKKTLEQEKEHRQKKMLRTSQIIFVIALFLSLGTAFYFYSELSPSFNLFGPNTTAKITEENAKLRSLKKTENKYRYLAAQLDLNSFSFATVQYLDKTAKLAGATDKGTLSADIADIENSIPTILESLRKNIGQPITLDLFAPEGTLPVDEVTNITQFEDDLRAALQEYRDQLAADAGGSATIQQDLKFVDNAVKLVGNPTLRSTLLSTPIDVLKTDLAKYSETQEPLQRDKLQALFTSILSSTSSDIATIGSIKASRINWSEIIKQIETVTTTVDINFGKSGVYKTEAGGIRYNSYTFDQQSAKIAVSGETKTADATNFTKISKLINAFEESPYFTGAEMRSFSKSGSLEEGYTASFSLNLSLESGGVSSKNKTVTLGRDTLRDRTGIRRIKRMP